MMFDFQKIEVYKIGFHLRHDTEEPAVKLQFRQNR